VKKWLNEIYRALKQGFGFAREVYSLWIFLIYFGCWIIFYLFPFEIFRDNLNLNQTISSGVFHGIVGNFSSILGILITLTILLFGLLREKLKRFALKEFLQNSSVKALVTITITIFIFNIFTLILVSKEDPSGHELSIAYFTIFSLILYLISLFPLLLRAIDTINPKEIVIKRVNSLKQEDFPEQQDIHFEIIDDNQIFILRNLLNVSYHDYDISVVNQVLYSVTFKTSDIVNDHKKDEAIVGRLIDGLIIIWKEYSGNAIKNKDGNNLARIFECLRYLHSSFSKNKIPLLLLNEIDFYIRNLLTKIVEESIYDPLPDITFNIEMILSDHYQRSTPQEGEITSLRHFFGDPFLDVYPAMRDIKPTYNKTRVESNIQWSKISEEIPAYLTIILSESIKRKQSNAFNTVFRTMESIEISALRSSLGCFQKEYILNLLQHYYYFYQIDAIEKKVITQPYEVFFPSIELAAKAIDMKFRFVNEIIRRDFKFIADLNSKNILDLTHRHLVYCGAIGRHCMMYIEKDTFYNQSMHVILDEIKTLKEILEKETRNSANIQELLLDINSFVRYYNRSSRNKEEDKPTISEENKALVQKIEDLIASFASL